MSFISKFYESTNGNEILPSMMLGVVTNNNDPQQMGRVQVLIPALSEHEQHIIEDHLPWASYVSPFGGIDERSSRGPAVEGQDVNSPYGSKSQGPVSYGMWAIPKVGSRVVVVAIDNDPNQLYYIGCVMTNSTPHTMPHGRYITGIDGVEQGPEGPLSTTENPIEPLYSNSMKAFVDHENFEWRSRGADYGVAAVSPNRLQKKFDNDTSEDHTGVRTSVIDDRDTTITEDDGQTVGKDLTYRQGYALSRSDPNKKTNDSYHEERNKRTDRNLEPSVTSITTPGFHALSMDDRPENCRIRFRTTTGHQMIMDDTNERIYISTNEGRNWIEMDSDGNVMIYSQQSVAIRAEGDINLTSEAKIRMTAKDGIHMKSGAEFRIHADERADMVFEKDLNIHVRDADNVKSNFIFEKDLLIHNKQNVDWIVDQTTEMLFKQDVDIHCNTDIRWTVDQNIHTNVGQNWYLTTGLTANFEVGSSMHYKVGTKYELQIGSTFSVQTSSNFNLDHSGNLKLDGGLVAGGSISNTGGVKTSGDMEATGTVKGSKISDGMYSLDLHQHNHGTPYTSPTSLGSPGSASVSPVVPSPGAWNGTPATTATDAQQALQAYEAFWTILTPAHEPWGRNFQANTDNNAITLDNNPGANDHSMVEFDNNSPNVGKDLRLDFSITTPTDPSNQLKRLQDRKRNPLWHR